MLQHREKREICKAARFMFYISSNHDANTHPISKEAETTGHWIYWPLITALFGRKRAKESAAWKTIHGRFPNLDLDSRDLDTLYLDDLNLEQAYGTTDNGAPINAKESREDESNVAAGQESKRKRADEPNDEEAGPNERQARKQNSESNISGNTALECRELIEHAKEKLRAAEQNFAAERARFSQVLDIAQTLRERLHEGMDELLRNWEDEGLGPQAIEMLIQTIGKIDRQFIVLKDADRKAASYSFVLSQEEFGKVHWTERGALEHAQPLKGHLEALCLDLEGYGAALKELTSVGRALNEYFLTIPVAYGASWLEALPPGQP